MNNYRLQVLGEGLAFLEGPRWRGRELTVSDMYGRRVLRREPDGPLETVCEVPSRPSGLAWDAEGNLLISSMADRRVLRWRGRELEVFADLSSIVAGDLNDMIGDGRGGVYVGNFGFDADAGEELRPTCLVHVASDGAAREVGESLVFPNGMAITPEGVLLVAETFACRISAFDIAEDGSLANRRVWAAFGKEPIDQEAAIASGNILPDGICLDSEGAVWVADAGGEGAFRVGEGDRILDEVRTPGESIYAVALGGERGTTLYLCAGAKLGTADLEIERRARLLACEVAVPAPDPLGTPSAASAERQSE